MNFSMIEQQGPHLMTSAGGMTDDGRAVIIHAPSADTIELAGASVLTGFIPGTPRPKQGGQIVRRGGRVRFVSAATINPHTRRYRELVERSLAESVGNAGGADAVAARVPAGWGLVVVLRWTFKTVDAKRWGTQHESKPDVDNLAKLWMDAAKITGALAGRDDSAPGLELWKLWGQQAGCGWTVRAVPKQGGFVAGVLSAAMASGAWWQGEAS